MKVMKAIKARMGTAAPASNSNANTDATTDEPGAGASEPTLEEQMENLRASDGDLEEEAEATIEGGDGNNIVAEASEPSKPRTEARPFQFIPLTMGGNGRTHQPSEASRAMIETEVSLAQLTAMTEAFYDKAFRDKTLDRFIRSHDDPHAARFAKWIHQKLAGSRVWDADRRSRDLSPVVVAGGRAAAVSDRSSAHVAAWHSPKRPPGEVGRRFRLDECRVWMRLHFWAVREVGLVDASPTFADYYVRFIGHFVRVYEGTAPPFARDSFRWSADPGNVRRYVEDGREMRDVVGASMERAAGQIPREEFEDTEWPYNRR